jgi:hypothetical protein
MRFRRKTGEQDLNQRLHRLNGFFRVLAEHALRRANGSTHAAWEACSTAPSQSVPNHLSRLRTRRASNRSIRPSTSAAKTPTLIKSVQSVVKTSSPSIAANLSAL